MDTADESTPLEKFMLAMGLAGVLVIGGFFLASYWSTRIPSRPSTVAVNAVFLWAPAVGLPAPRRGSWLSCSEQEMRDHCRLSNIDGLTEYEGWFVRYGDRGVVPAAQLKIDPDKSRRDAVWVGSALVPLIYLQDGEILIPASKYEEGARLLERSKATE